MCVCKANFKHSDHTWNYFLNNHLVEKYVKIIYLWLKMDFVTNDHEVILTGNKINQPNF